MSEFAAYADRLNIQEQITRIDRMITETQKFQIESTKLQAEREKLFSESSKLQAERQKLSRDRFLALALVGVSILSGVVAVVTLVLHAGSH